MSVRAGPPPAQTVDAVLASAFDNMHEPLAEGNGFATANPDYPLHRDICVSIRASLNDLCLQKGKGKWEPSPEALKHMFQQRRFTSLDGSSESSGDLKSVVLHGLEVKHSKSTFPVSLGARVTGVDDNTFATTGEAFSTVLLPQSENTTPRMLQADDVGLCYDFAKKVRPCSPRNVPVAAFRLFARNLHAFAHRSSRATRVRTCQRRGSTRCRRDASCSLPPTTRLSRRSRRTPTSCRWATSR